MVDNDYKNSEGYKDTTAYQAITNLLKTEHVLYSREEEDDGRTFDEIPTIVKMQRFLDDYQKVAMEIFTATKDKNKTTKKYILKSLRVYEFCKRNKSKSWFTNSLVATNFHVSERFVEQVMSNRGDVWICLEAWESYQKTGLIM